MSAQSVCDDITAGVGGFISVCDASKDSSFWSLASEGLSCVAEGSDGFLRFSSEHVGSFGDIELVLGDDDLSYGN